MVGKADADANWFLYVWDIKTDEPRKAMFYKKLNGYQQRKYIGVVDEVEAIAERLQGKDLVNIDPDELPKGIDGVTEDGRLYKIYEYRGVLEEIPPDNRVRLNDSAYAFFEATIREIEELLEEYKDIFGSLYRIPVAEWNEIEDIIPEGENNS